jgi:hypothetical protein
VDSSSSSSSTSDDEYCGADPQDGGNRHEDVDQEFDESGGEETLLFKVQDVGNKKKKKRYIHGDVERELKREKFVDITRHKWEKAIEDDSDLEDLMELEKIEQDKLKRRGPHRNQDTEMDDDMSTDHGSIKIMEIQKLIKRRKAKKDCEMKAKISNGFVDQLLISMLINKVYVKETL